MHQYRTALSFVGIVALSRAAHRPRRFGSASATFPNANVLRAAALVGERAVDRAPHALLRRLVCLVSCCARTPVRAWAAWPRSSLVLGVHRSAIAISGGGGGGRCGQCGGGQRWRRRREAVAEVTHKALHPVQHLLVRRAAAHVLVREHGVQLAQVAQLQQRRMGSVRRPAGAGRSCEVCSLIPQLPRCQLVKTACQACAHVFDTVALSNVHTHLV